MPYRAAKPRTTAEPHHRHARDGAPRHPAKRQDYTLNHAGRQFRIGPITFWLGVSTLIVMGLWSAATATYFAFRDDVLTRLIARQADMQYAYEDRVSELRGQVDRLTSRQLLDQEQVEQRIEQLSQRQRTLEQRASTLQGLPDDVTGSIRGGHARPGRKGDTADKQSAVDNRYLGLRTRTHAAAKTDHTTTLARIQESLDRVEAKQSASLLAMEDGYETKTRRIRSVLSELGMNVAKASGAAPAGVGGPFVPPTIGLGASGFDRQMQRVQIARANFERVNRAMVAVPLRTPLAGEHDLSSGFGVRLDPFMRRPAMHTGLDFRGATGEPARATAAGKVTNAGWSGGYGRMVEIDHGNGFATRYGHLSEILVKDGQTVRPGQIVGRVGSTGRSTGPHLHYETRIDGEAVDPHRFLRAGARLGEKL